MKRIAFFGAILVLLATSAVPVLAKTPGNNNGNAANGGSAITQNLPEELQQQAEHQVQDHNQSQGAQHSQNANHNQFRETNEVRNGSQGQSSRMRTPFYLQGSITAIDTVTQTLTVSITHGNAQVKASIGMTLTLQANDSTQIYKIIQGNDGEMETGNRLPITFDQLAVNDIVAIHGNLVDGVYQVTLITVYVPMLIGAPMNVQP